MSKILIYFLVGISLSMDAFSLALSIGTTSPSKKTIRLLTIWIGLFHFFMPLLGNRIGLLFSNYLLMKANYLVSFIFLLLAFEMYRNRNVEEEPKDLKQMTILFIALTVSIDSLTVGFAFGLNQDKTLLPNLLFMFTSSIFTLLGLYLGKTIKNKYQKQSTYIGIFIMIMIALKYFIQR